MGFWVLLDNIYDCVFTTLDFPININGKFISMVRFVNCIYFYSVTKSID